MEVDLTGLSRTMSHALRHEPWVYELELDDEGWTSVSALLGALRRERSAFTHVTEADLTRVISTSSKRRFEIVGDRIRAIYGHSLPGKLTKLPLVPPCSLYHGTAPSALQSIRKSGLLPMGRQYVHLSFDESTALEVVRRKANRPVILRIAAGQAYSEGIQFYQGNERVCLADYVPPQFIIIGGV
jgi:putative RNA 2'-phosphotransferase